jgi:hypothetical protein
MTKENGSTSFSGNFMITLNRDEVEIVIEALAASDPDWTHLISEIVRQLRICIAHDKEHPPAPMTPPPPSRE